MKKSILIDASGNRQWIGGLYYKKNIVFSLLQNKTIIKKYNIVIIAARENIDLFEEFQDLCTIEVLDEKTKLRLIKLVIIAIKKRSVAIFPCGNRIFGLIGLIGIKTINWIPDFQHKYFPDYFKQEEIVKRDMWFSYCANNVHPLVLSSVDSANDFYRFYEVNPHKPVEIVHFVSDIGKIIIELTPEYEKKILKKFEISESKYVCIMNQFWQHKNHELVLKAIQNLKIEEEGKTVTFVFTGNLSDYRNTDYIKRIDALLNESEIKEKVRMLGFIDRREQIVLMKNAEYIIQPSLFEGWGTVVEDAKVLDKTILLSDIPVHREQMNEKCILFDPYDSEKLRILIEEENNKEHIDDVQRGIKDMKKRAAEYSKGFQNLLM